VLNSNQLGIFPIGDGERVRDFLHCRSIAPRRVAQHHIIIVGAARFSKRIRSRVEKLFSGFHFVFFIRLRPGALADPEPCGKYRYA
jgi:hypothetical protein